MLMLKNQLKSKSENQDHRNQELMMALAKNDPKQDRPVYPPNNAAA